jgi:hypothetical protein
MLIMIADRLSRFKADKGKAEGRKAGAAEGRKGDKSNFHVLLFFGRPRA